MLLSAKRKAGIQLQADALDFSQWIRSGDTVLWGQSNAEPLTLTQALMAQCAMLPAFQIMLGISVLPTCLPEHAAHVRFKSYCGSGANRALIKAGCLDIIPCHYSQLPVLMRSGKLRIDVVLVQVSAPDEYGRMSLSLANEYLIPALETASVIVAEINEQAPCVYGERTLSINEVDAFVVTDRPVLETSRALPSEVEQRIADHVAALVSDGATLQVGIGSVPEAVLSSLSGHHHLGVHTGSLGDGIAELMSMGVIDNSRKSIDAGISVGGVIMGSKKLHAFVHRNLEIKLRSCEYTHAAEVLAAQRGLVSINSALEVDLSGQVNTEAANGTYIGAVGGALDFHRGASHAQNGLPIIALPAMSRAGSRIVASLSGPVTISRSDTGIVVTEYGVADLRGLSLAQRAQAMVSIAAPECRQDLLRLSRSQ